MACARIGAAHSVIFGGFSPESIVDRVNDAECVALITADFGWRRGKTVPLKQNCDVAMERTPSIRHCIVARRIGDDVFMKDGRDIWWDEAIADQPASCEPEPMDAEDLLFLLYTSGTTAKPKGIKHTTGGYLTHVTMTHETVFDLQPDTDVYWCTADIGWVTGHSYIVYGPLANGASSVLYEGTPDYPDKDRFWEIVERYGVTILYTAPTAIRTFMKWGTRVPAASRSFVAARVGFGRRADQSRSVDVVSRMDRRQSYAGRGYVVADGDRRHHDCAVAGRYDAAAGQRDASVARHFCRRRQRSRRIGSTRRRRVRGADAAVARMLRGIWGDDERYVQTYWSKFPHRYFAGDGARRDADGNFWFMGRIDDVMNVSGHRISTTEVESALVDHPKVAEAAVCGKLDDMTGQAIYAFVSLKGGVEGSTQFADELRDHVAEKLGKFTRPKYVTFTQELPKTRSGKIMRRLLRDIAEGRTLGDTTTLADSAVVHELAERAKLEASQDA